MRGLLLIAALWLLLSCNGNKAHSGEHSFETPIEYNDFIVDQQNVIIHHMIELSRSYDSSNPDTIRKAFKLLVSACDSSKALIDELTPYENDSTVKTAARNLFDFYSSIFHKEYQEMLDIFLKGELASDAEVIELNRIVIYVRDKEAILNQELTQAQQTFSVKEGFKFEGNMN